VEDIGRDEGRVSLTVSSTSRRDAAAHPANVVRANRATSSAESLPESCAASVSRNGSSVSSLPRLTFDEYSRKLTYTASDEYRDQSINQSINNQSVYSFKEPDKKARGGALTLPKVHKTY